MSLAWSIVIAIGATALVTGIALAFLPEKLDALHVTLMRLLSISTAWFALSLTIPESISTRGMAIILIVIALLGAIQGYREYRALNKRLREADKLKATDRLIGIQKRRAAMCGRREGK